MIFGNEPPGVAVVGVAVVGVAVVGVAVVGVAVVGVAVVGTTSAAHRVMGEKELSRSHAHPATAPNRLDFIVPNRSTDR